MLLTVEQTEIDDAPEETGESVLVPLRCSDPISYEHADQILIEHTIDKRLDTVTVADWFPQTWLEGRLRFVTSGVSDDGTFHLWRGTHWEAIPTSMIENDLTQIFRKPKLTSEIVKIIKAHKSVCVSRDSFDALQGAIFLKSKVLEIKGDKVVPREHHIDDRNTSFIDLDPDPIGKCPQWEKFLERTLPEPKARLLLQEIFGACLVRGFNPQCFFVIAGEAGTGKSTATDILNFMLGGSSDPMARTVAPNVTSRDLGSLGDRFGTAGLERSLVNISAEGTYLSPAAESVLKRLTGGDPVQIEYKNRDPFFVFTAPKMIVVTNTIPRFSDRSSALYQRAVILPFEQQIDMKEAKPGLSSEIFKAEGGAILWWALRGLVRVLKSGGSRSDRFTRPDCSIESLEEHRRESNPIADWFAERIEINQEAVVEKEQAYTDFQGFCNATGKPSNLGLREKGQFVRAVNSELRRRKIPVGKDDRKRLKRGGPPVRVFCGVKLVETSQFAEGNGKSDDGGFDVST